MTISNRVSLVAASFLLWGVPSSAKTDTNAAPKRAEIGVHKKNFDELTPEERQKLREKRARFQEFPPAEQARIQKHLKFWKELSPEQQENLRQLHQKLKNAPPEEKADLQKKIGQFQQLPPEQQREIIHKKTRLRHRDTDPGPLPEPSPELQKRVKSQYNAIWNDLPPEHKRILARMHQRVENARETTANVPPEQRAALEERLKKFDQLPPEAQKERLQKMADHRKKRMQDP